MRILDRYILKSVLAIFLSCIFLFLFLYVIIDILSHLEDILKSQINFTLLVKYYLASIPMMLSQITPFACLLSTLYAFGKFNHANEIIAMRSSGLSIFQITKTVIVFGFIVSIFMFWVNERIMPRSLSVREEISKMIELGKRKNKNEIIENLAMYGFKNRLFFVNKYNLRNNTMEGITILEHDEKQNVIKKIMANKAVYKEGVWTFYQSITYSFDTKGQISGEPQYLNEELMPIPETPKDFIAQRKQPEAMSINQLDDYIWKLSKSGASTVIRRLKIELLKRFVSPFSSLIIILLGIPFALRIRKKAIGISSIGVAVIVSFLYYVINAVSIALGNNGIIPAAIAVSFAHILAIGFSVYLINSLP